MKQEPVRRSDRDHTSSSGQQSRGSQGNTMERYTGNEERCSQGGGGAFGGVAWGTGVSQTDLCSKKVEITFVTMCVNLINHIKSTAILLECVDGRDILILI